MRNNVLLALILVCGVGPVRADDKIEFSSVRIVGTVVTIEDLRAEPEDTVAPKFLGTYVGKDGFYIELKPDGGKGRVWVGVRCDKAMRERALKMKGVRVVVEGKGECVPVTKEVAEMRGDKFFAVKVSEAVLHITATKIGPAPEIVTGDEK